MKPMKRCVLVVFMALTLLFVFACENTVKYEPPPGSTETSITFYTFGKMTIDSKDYDGDLIILPGGTVKNWPIDLGTHMLGVDDIAPLITESVKSIIIGTGNAGAVELSDEVQQLLDKLKEKGVKVFVNKSGSAVKQFNSISKEGLLAFFHLNC